MNTGCGSPRADVPGSVDAPAASGILRNDMTTMAAAHK
jgi:hypothetical protein